MNTDDDVALDNKQSYLKQHTINNNMDELDKETKDKFKDKKLDIIKPWEAL